MQPKLFKVLVGKEIRDDFNDSIQIFSPINNQIIGSIPRVKNKYQIDKICHEAKEAFAIYKNTSFESRKNKLLNFCELLNKNWDEISNLIVQEIAKSKRDAIKEIERTIDYIKLTIDEYEKMINKQPMIIDSNVHNIKGKTGKFYYEPLGVVLAISPFNYPLNLLMTKLAPALISGNVVVYKPATQGSCLGAFISLLLYESGFKNGEVSCVIGKGSEVGDWLIENSDINMITFTGSTSVGKRISQLNPLIPVSLELGGKDAAIVLKDADIAKTAANIVKGAFLYNGQRCTGIKRVLVDDKVAYKLVDAINYEINKLTVGSASEGNFDVTEMISANSIKYNLHLLLDALQKGALTDQNIRLINNNILAPVVLYNVNPNCKIYYEEQFGPVLPIISFKSIESAIEINNESEYGLQASIYTEDIELANKIAKSLDVVTVNINQSPSRGPDIFPFGGIKNSGKGMQGIKDAIMSMNRIKGVIEND